MFGFMDGLELGNPLGFAPFLNGRILRILAYPPVATSLSGIPLT